MSLEALLTQTVSITGVTEGDEVDEYNDPVEVEAVPKSYPAWLEQTETREVLVDRETVLSDWLLVLPPYAVVDTRSHVHADGMEFSVVGRPVEPRTPRGVHHIECRLRLIEG